MYVLRPITHVANDYLLLVIIESTDIAVLALRALPGEVLDEVRVQRGLMAQTVVGFLASAALYTFLCGIKG